MVAEALRLGELEQSELGRPVGEHSEDILDDEEPEDDPIDDAQGRVRVAVDAEHAELGDKEPNGRDDEHPNTGVDDAVDGGPGSVKSGVEGVGHTPDRFANPQPAPPQEQRDSAVGRRAEAMSWEAGALMGTFILNVAR